MLKQQERSLTSTRSRKEIKQSILRTAFDEGRGPEMIAKIQAVVRQVQSDVAHGVAELRNFERWNAGASQAVRADNLIQERFPFKLSLFG